MTTWQPQDKVLTDLYPKSASKKASEDKVRAERPEGWNQPSAKVRYPSMADEEEKQKIAEIHKQKLQQRQKMFDDGKLGVASIMFPSMDDLVSEDQIQKAIQNDKMTEMQRKYHENDLLFNSMHHKTTVDGFGNLVSVKETK
jgi:hypothetical protein